MPKFIFAYHGGSGPEDMSEADVQQVMQAWMKWFEDMGDAVVEMGNPVGMSTTVNSDGSVSDNGGSNPISGYTIVQADTMEAAQALAKAGPVLTSGGSIEIAEIHEMG